MVERIEGERGEKGGGGGTKQWRHVSCAVKLSLKGGWDVQACWQASGRIEGYS